MADGKWTINGYPHGTVQNTVELSVITRGAESTVEIEADWAELPDDRMLGSANTDLQYLKGEHRAIKALSSVVAGRSKTLHAFRVLGFDFRWSDIRISAESQLAGGLDKRLVESRVALSIFAPKEDARVMHVSGEVILETAKRWEPFWIQGEEGIVLVSSREISIESQDFRNVWEIVPARIETVDGPRLSVSAERLGIRVHSLDTAPQSTAEIESVEADGAAAKIKLSNLRLYETVRVLVKCDPVLPGRPTRTWPVEFRRIS